MCIGAKFNYFLDWTSSGESRMAFKVFWEFSSLCFIAMVSVFRMSKNEKYFANFGEAAMIFRAEWIWSVAIIWFDRFFLQTWVYCPPWKRNILMTEKLRTTYKIQNAKCGTMNGIRYKEIQISLLVQSRISNILSFFNSQNGNQMSFRLSQKKRTISLYK